MNSEAPLELVAMTEKMALEPSGEFVAGAGGAEMPGGVRNCLPWENSDVLLAGSVAVAVITEPPGTEVGKVTVKFPLQLASVVTMPSPKYV